MFDKFNDRELAYRVTNKDNAQIKALQKLTSSLQNSNNTQEAKESAVLILLYHKKNELYFCLIQRTKYKGIHSGQISLPGGKKEIEDFDLKTTAQRETNEEIGIKPDIENIFGPLNTIYIAPSNFIVSPYISFYQTEPLFVKEDREVDEILEIRVNELLHQRLTTEVFINSDKSEFNALCYILENKKVWGATASILSELKIILS